MKTKLIKIVATGLCIALSLCVLPTVEVKAEDAPSLAIDKLLDGAKAALGNMFNADYETKWANDGEDSEFISYLISEAMTSGRDENGYVTTPDQMAGSLGERGIAYANPIWKGTKFAPGDIISVHNRVYLALGSCEDGSVLVVTTDEKGGVHLAGSVERMRTFSQASNLASGYMAARYPEWYKTVGGRNLCRVSDSQIRSEGTVAVFHHPFTTDVKKLRRLSAEDILHYFATGEVPGGAPSNGSTGNPSNPGGANGADGNDGPASPFTADNSGLIIISGLGLLVSAAGLLRKREF